ncbi:MAG: hypothetical protein PHC75_07385 [Burkholderiales bacterium]|nr:hypothetical protein [Burkholderiales bacterium]
MKIKQIISSVLLSGLVGGAMVACGGGGGGSSYTPPAAPVVHEETVPAGFTLGSDTNGAAFGGNFESIVIPGASGYSAPIVLDTQVQNALQNAGSNPIAVSVSGNQLVISVTDNSVSPVKTSVFVQALPQASNLKNLTTGYVESYTLYGGVTTNLLPLNYKNQNSALMSSSTAGTVSIAFPNPTPGNESAATGACTGSITTISTASSGGNSYVAVGDSQGNVCVAGLNNNGLNPFTNLSAEAPASGPSQYTKAPVHNFGFPSTLNNGNNLVGYWYVGNQIYKVLGTGSMSNPVKNAFFNTTTSQTQTAQTGGTQVTFTGAPVAADINSMFTDNVGNVWVGGVSAKVYVLRNGATQWTSTALNGALGGVVVSYNGTNSGATVTTTLGGTSVYNVQ